jgi:hypothetical protein
VPPVSAIETLQTALRSVGSRADIEYQVVEDAGGGFWFSHGYCGFDEAAAHADLAAQRASHGRDRRFGLHRRLISEWELVPEARAFSVAAAPPLPRPHLPLNDVDAFDSAGGTPSETDD